MKPERTFTRLTAAEAAMLLQKQAHVFDARDEKSFAASHIDGAILLDSGSLNTLLFGTPKHDAILIYCYHGNASQTYGQMFADFGFKNVHDLIGGYEEWQQYVNSASAHASETPSAQLKDWLMVEGFAGSPDTTITNATTPLMHAARHGNTSIVQELIALKANLAALNLDGNNALWLACFNGNIDIIECLVAAGIDINHQNHNGATCLMYAASAGKTDVVASLLKAGADVTPKSLDDFSALDMASNIECLQLLRHANPRKTLTETA